MREINRIWKLKDNYDGDNVGLLFRCEEIKKDNEIIEENEWESIILKEDEKKEMG